MLPKYKEGQAEKVLSLVVLALKLVNAATCVLSTELSATVGLANGQRQEKSQETWISFLWGRCWVLGGEQILQSPLLPSPKFLLSFYCLCTINPRERRNNSGPENKEGEPP